MSAAAKQYQANAIGLETVVFSMRFSAFTALDKISIKIRPGSLHALLGDNGVRYLPEEPLQNACAPKMSVAENLAFRNFDVNGAGPPQFWLNHKAIRQNAAQQVSAFNIKTRSLDSPIAALSGGNVQRAVLARELSGQVNLLIIANPCFGLDFAAVAEIRARIIKARNEGAAVLLISEDLDEILELSDCVLVMSEGRINYETPIKSADVAVIGRYMAGHA